MNNETPTPRTDKVVSDDMGDSRFLIDLITHAQQLERALNEARKTIRECNDYEQDQRVLFHKVESERDQLRKVADELANTLLTISHEHYTSMQEARDIGYSDGLFLKPSLAINVSNCNTIYNSLPHVQQRKTK